jgi:LPS-assembly lipoprotein
MWSFEPQKPHHPGLFALAAAALIALGGCNVSPLYGPTVEDSALSTDLAAISIDPPDSRVEQEIRNKLIFDFNGGAAATQPVRYALHLTANVSEAPVGTSQIAVAPSYSLSVAASYELTDISTQRIVARGVARGTAAYDRTNQAFANTRARLDAEDRAAASAADQIRLRLSAALVTGT